MGCSSSFPLKDHFRSPLVPCQALGPKVINDVDDVYDWSLRNMLLCENVVGK